MPGEASVLGSNASCDVSEGLHSRLARHEGRRKCVYTDTLGHPTIGVGHSLRQPADMDLCWTDAKIDSVLQADIAQAEANAAYDYGDGFNELPQVRQDVLTEMAFQLGGSGLLHFSHMLESLRAGDPAKAAEEMLASKWHHQTAARAEELACLMETGE